MVQVCKTMGFDGLPDHRPAYYLLEYGEYLPIKKKKVYRKKPFNISVPIHHLTFLNLFSSYCSRNAYYQPTSCRPRFLLVGEPGYGQTSHLAPAVIHALEKFPVYTLDLSVLFVSVTSPEETCAQVSFFSLIS